jgi:exodeoxyribonuclease VII large subunit
MFAGNRSGLAFRMTEGMQVVVRGTIDVYERDGKYQMYAKTIEQEGTGALYRQFELLKQELLERGMFAAEYKKPIPKYIKTLGVVTAPTGAAVRDIINIATRRNPYVQILLYPAIVQGEAAPESIIRGIQALERKGVDVMIVGRGGGSIEDLWAFNEEAVAQAVFDCSIPVISAVGHETDTTIIDYVADLRAPTPSAAAELAVYDVNMVKEQLYRYENTMLRLLKNKLSVYQLRLDRLQTKLKAASPVSKIREKRMFALSLEERLNQAMKNQIITGRHRLAIYIEKLKGLSPLDKLNQGYAYVSDQSGKTVTDVNKISLGDKLSVYVKNGRLEASVTGKEIMNKQ